MCSLSGLTTCQVNWWIFWFRSPGTSIFSSIFCIKKEWRSNEIKIKNSHARILSRRKQVVVVAVVPPLRLYTTIPPPSTPLNINNFSDSSMIDYCHEYQKELVFEQFSWRLLFTNSHHNTMPSNIFLHLCMSVSFYSSIYTLLYSSHPNKKEVYILCLPCSDLLLRGDPSCSFQELFLQIWIRWTLLYTESLHIRHMPVDTSHR